MQRVAFQLRVKPGSEEAYDEAHRHVWPELLSTLQNFGVREYSIFRRQNEIFLYMLVPDFHALLTRLAQSDVDRRWQQTMEPLLERVPSLREGEPFAMMEEVFYMQGATDRKSALEPALEKSGHAG